MTSEQIRIEYVPVDQVIRWEQNPKRHDIGAIAESIRRFGFRDPPAFDSTLGALVHGNGRTETLVWMRDEGQEPPRGIALDERGRWCMPVVFGNDAESTTEAVAYAIAHNNLTMAGGDYTALDMARMWDDTYLPILRDLAEAEALPPTIDAESLGTLILVAEGRSGGPVDPVDLWKGMPEFEQEGFAEYKSLIVHFKAEEDYQAFAQLIEQSLTIKTKSVWYPERPEELQGQTDRSFVYTTDEP